MSRIILSEVFGSTLPSSECCQVQACCLCYKCLGYIYIGFLFWTPGVLKEPMVLLSRDLYTFSGDIGWLNNIWYYPEMLGYGPIYECLDQSPMFEMSKYANCFSPCKIHKLRDMSSIQEEDKHAKGLCGRHGGLVQFSVLTRSSYQNIIQHGVSTEKQNDWVGRGSFW